MDTLPAARTRACGKEARISTATDDEEFETNYPAEEEGRGEEGEGQRGRSAEARSEETGISSKDRGGRDVGSNRSDVGSRIPARGETASILGSDRRFGRF
jgi:hypothetical protein